MKLTDDDMSISISHRKLGEHLSSGGGVFMSDSQGEEGLYYDTRL